MIPIVIRAILTLNSNQIPPKRQRKPKRQKMSLASKGFAIALKKDLILVIEKF